MRKIPSKKEICKYFENADIVKENYHGELEFKVDLSKSRFSSFGNYVQGNNHLYLWSVDHGYAKILSYKTPRFEITKETILKYNMKDEFPEAFEVELTVGKWYKFTEGTIAFFQGVNNTSYGIHHLGKDWFSSHLWFADYNLKSIDREATTEEVKEALIAEAKKRGFKEGVYCVDNTSNKLNYLGDGDFYFSENLYFKGANIFKDGKWATIIPTITKAEAEKLLNKKII